MFFLYNLAIKKEVIEKETTTAKDIIILSKKRKSKKEYKEIDYCKTVGDVVYLGIGCRSITKLKGKEKKNFDYCVCLRNLEKNLFWIKHDYLHN